MLDMTTAEELMKYHYGAQTLKEIAYQKRPALALIPKYEGFGGKSMPLPLSIGNVRNRSATIAGALRSGLDFDSSEQVEFLLTRVKNYEIGRVDGEVIEAAKGDRNAFVNGLEHEIRKATEALADDTHSNIFLDGTGALGSVTISGTSVTFADPWVLHRVQKGDYLVFGNAGTYGNLRGTPVGAKVTAVNRSTGVVTIAANTDSAATGDVAFHLGDRPASGLTVGSATWYKMSGFGGWIPASDPSSTAHFGVDRTADLAKLGGVRVAGTDAMQVEEALITAALDLSVLGGATGIGEMTFMHPRNGGVLMKELGSKKEYMAVQDADGIVGFRALMVDTPLGGTKVVLDHACPINRAFMLTMSTWRLNSAGPIMRLDDVDSNRILRATDADSFEFRLKHYAQISCDAPGLNATFPLSDAS